MLFDPNLKLISKYKIQELILNIIVEFSKKYAKMNHSRHSKIICILGLFLNNYKKKKSNFERYTSTNVHTSHSRDVAPFRL